VTGVGLYVGASVLTRRMKRGTVVAIGEGTVDVRFGSRVFTMRNGDVVNEHAYRKSTLPKGHGNMYGGRL